MAQQIRIDEKLRELIPPIAPDEFRQLEENILREGIRDPLVVWEGTLLDGHNRYRIAQEHGLDFQTVEPEGVGDYTDARLWMIRNQLGRRNLSNYDRGVLALKLKDAIAEKAKQRQGQRTDLCPNLDKGSEPIDTKKELAEAAGVSHGTIHKIEHIERDGPDAVKERVRSGDMSIHRAYRVTQATRDLPDPLREAFAQSDVTQNPRDLERIAKMQPEQRAEVVEKIVSGQAASVTDAQRKAEQFEREKCKKERVESLNTYRPKIFNADAIPWLESQEMCDLLITDPPYMTDVDDIQAFSQSWLPQALNRVKPTGRAYICIGPYPQELNSYLNICIPKHLVLSNVLVWTYRNTLGPSPKMAYKNNWQAILYYYGVNAKPLNCPIMLEQFTVQDINAPDGRHGDRYHAWQKPDELAIRLISHSTKRGDLVLDPFCGTGTFLLAAGNLSRFSMGCDTDNDMLEIASKRGCLRA